jgi:hypothetical protein
MSPSLSDFCIVLTCMCYSELSNLGLRRTLSVPFASYLNSRFLGDLYLFERFVPKFRIVLDMLMRYSGPRK